MATSKKPAPKSTKKAVKQPGKAFAPKSPLQAPGQQPLF